MCRRGEGLPRRRIRTPMGTVVAKKLSGPRGVYDYVVTTCESCSEPISGRSDRRFCSTRCRMRAHRAGRRQTFVDWRAAAWLLEVGWPDEWGESSASTRDVIDRSYGSEGVSSTARRRLVYRDEREFGRTDAYERAASRDQRDGRAVRRGEPPEARRRSSSRTAGDLSARTIRRDADGRWLRGGRGEGGVWRRLVIEGEQ